MRVSLNGIVSADDDLEIYQWLGFSAFSPATLRQAVEDNPEGEELVLEINSGGGSVFAGFEMYSVLRAAKVKTRAEVQSLAASAASTLIMGCDEVLMSPVAQMMIHLPTVQTEGDRAAHRESIKVLDSITQSILNGYEAKSQGKRTRAQLEQMVHSTTWMTAQEAVDAGLADGILYGEEPVPANVVNSITGGIRALAGAGAPLDLETMRAEYRRQKQAQTGQSSGADNWTRTARAALDLEQIRF